MGVRDVGGHFDEPLAAPEPLAGALVVPFDFPVRHDEGVDADHALEEGETGPRPVVISRDGVTLEYLHGFYLTVFWFSRSIVRNLPFLVFVFGDAFNIEFLGLVGLSFAGELAPSIHLKGVGDVVGRIGTHAYDVFYLAEEDLASGGRVYDGPAVLCLVDDFEITSHGYIAVNGIFPL